jgi:amidophosphoribosyltransferase
MGRALARTIAKEPSATSIDVVIPVPETSYISALAAAQTIGKPFAFGLVKNRYIGRTFIMPNQDQRRKGVASKLNAVRSEFEGKHVLLVDDSIVRGTTSKAIVQMAYAAGAKRVTFASCSPAIR